MTDAETFSFALKTLIELTHNPWTIVLIVLLVCIGGVVWLVWYGVTKGVGAVVTNNQLTHELLITIRDFKDDFGELRQELHRVGDAIDKLTHAVSGHATSIEATKPQTNNHKVTSHPYRHSPPHNTSRH